MQRIIWGFFKKLVISERATVLVNTIYADYETYNGLYILFAAIMFMIELYADFSGCIDIMLGISEIFGIKLPENFDLPFYARTVAEFWRRWHITLGAWLREFVFYPMLKSKTWQKLSEITKKRFGKKVGKKIPVWLGLMISWLIIGFWHGGGYNYIFGVGVYMGIIIVASEIIETPTKKIVLALGLNQEAISYKLFQMLRTFILITIGNSFFRAVSLADGFRMWKRFFEVINPWILFDGSIYNLGLAEIDVKILFFSVVLLIIVGIIKIEKGEEIRVLIASQNIVFRWGIYIALLLIVVIYGKYGPGYSASEFIYKGF